MEAPKILQPLVPIQTFWTGKEGLARGVVDGLLGSAYLLIFWTPLIIGLALPLETALLKTALCWGVAKSKGGDIPGVTYLGTNYVVNEPVARSIIYDNSEMYPSNTVAIIGFSLFSFFSVVMAFIFANMIIKSAGLDWYYVMKFNFVMAIIIALIEAVFFATVAFEYIPYNFNDIYQKSMAPILTTLQEYIDVSEPTPIPTLPH